MAYDERLASRVRRVLSSKQGVTEIWMMGGLGFMVRGNMSCGVHESKLVVRVGSKAYDKCLERPNAKPFDLTGRVLRGLVFIEPGGLRNAKSLTTWVLQGYDYAATLPAKKKTSVSTRKT